MWFCLMNIEMDWPSALKRSRAEASVLARRYREDRARIRSFTDEHSFRLTLDGAFVAVSDGFCSLLGYRRREFIRRSVARFSNKDALDIPRHLGAVCEFGIFRGLWLFQHRNGRAIIVRYAAELLHEGFIEVRLDPSKVD